MAKKKNNTNVKTRPKAKGPPPQQDRSRFGPASNRDNSPFPRSHGYTLAEEARNTASNRRGVRGRDARLRYQPVTFISAGFMDPLKDFEIPKQTVSFMQSKAAVLSPSASDGLVPTTLRLAEPRTQSPGINHEAQHPDVESDAGSDSSEEVILFKGRNAARERQKSPLRKPTNDRDVPREVNLELRFAKKTTNAAVISGSSSQVEELDFISLNTNHGKRSSSRKSHLNTNSGGNDDDAAIIADYIANMQNDDDDDEDDEEDIGHPGLGSHSFSVIRDLGGDLDGTDSDPMPSQPSSGDESGDELDEDEEEDDAYEGEKRHVESEDERLARLIAKQEELGLVDDNDLLFDGVDPDDGWIAATSMPRRKKGASKKSRIFQGGSQFPSATRMADAFDELDLMDMQSARLQRSKKGPISFGLSDSDLEDALNVAIKKDRLKKADKKRAREELRSQGLLGKNVNPHDLRIKYRGGMSLDDLADEVEVFMLSTREQLILPPFDKGARKIVHTIANTFNIKSKSAGTGTGRHPVLHRTKATLPYDQDLFEQAFNRVRRTWFPRVDVDERVVQETRVLKRAETRISKSRTGKSSIVLREGDVVGQHASEIGVENKGRAMLEKMGWIKGMSLGTVETKGIIVPLTHVIKKTKAGLGDI
ncbi:hypothetical protein E0Z10_g7997 [Xylaria hypoxylon]|uniref:Protein SQS1 n=1 Tax=Xylaria hypoxylon TaxID=37992 RepID=A0A4Z0YKW0_9PEZI|nr:hypothetical protein E0Z10_g7997 [Xylaria hypoxylon]